MNESQKNSYGYKISHFIYVCFIDIFPFYLKMNNGYLLQVISLQAENVFIVLFLTFAMIKYIFEMSRSIFYFLYVM